MNFNNLNGATINQQKSVILNITIYNSLLVLDDIPKSQEKAAIDRQFLVGANAFRNKSTVEYMVVL